MKPLARKRVTKEGRRDKELYIRVDEKAPAYLVVFREGRIIVGERVLRPTEKCVKSAGKRYCYKYVRVPLPWQSKLASFTGRWGTHELDVEVYPAGEGDFREYLRDLALVNHYGVEEASKRGAGSISMLPGPRKRRRRGRSIWDDVLDWGY